VRRRHRGSCLALADLEVRQRFERTHHGRVVPALAAVGDAAVEEFLGGRIDRDAEDNPYR
jgi:hypothetical protein